MNIEFLLLIWDYFRSLQKRNIIFELVIPFVASLIIFISIRVNNSEKCLSDYRSNIISLVGVLIGFSITAITLLITSNNANIENLKKIKPKDKNGREIEFSLYHLLLTNFSYLIVIEILLISLDLFFPAFNSMLNLSFTTRIVLFSLNSFLLLHILLLNLRTISDLYHTLISKENNSNN